MTGKRKAKGKKLKLKERLEELPGTAGVYLFKDAAGNVIYVGKANSLKARVSSYFQSKDLSRKTLLLVQAIRDIDYVLVDSETEALVLEATLIKKHRPKYNVLLKDDKRYPMLTITMQEEFPCIKRCRKIDEDGAVYFGPFVDSKAVNKVISIVKKYFGVRTCRSISKRGCIKCRIGACAGPCIGIVSPEKYKQKCLDAVSFLSGDRKKIKAVLGRKMRLASKTRDYEKAAAFRDQIDAVSGTYQQKISEPGNLEADVIAIARDGSACVAEVLFIRNGKVNGHISLPVRLSENAEQEEIYSSFIKQYYLNSFELPVEIAVPVAVPDKTGIENWIGEKRGSPVSIIQPKTGRMASLLGMTQKNAVLSVRLEKAREKKRNALSTLMDVLSLRAVPVRIEAFDISNIQGDLAVGSMVVFEDAAPAKSEYKRFRIKWIKRADDPAMIREVLIRRYSRKDGLPGLVLVDGGSAQVNAGKKAIDALGLQIPIVGLAKRIEELYLPGNPRPVSLPDDSPAILLLQALRDEAHRFAVSYHRVLRSKKMIGSELDGIPGIGPKRRKLLLERFGSVRGVCKASLPELENVIGKHAEAVFRHLRASKEQVNS